MYKEYGISDNGDMINASSPSTSDTEEQRKKKLAAITSMLTGKEQPVEADYSLTGQQAQTTQQIQQPTQEMQPVPPTAEQQPVQQPVATQQSPVAQPATPVNPNQVQAQLTPETTQQLASQAGITSSVNPEDLQLPQAGPGVQVAGTQPGAGVSQAANATVPGTGLKPPSQYQPYIDQFKSGDLYSLANPKAEAPQFIKTAAQEQLLSDFQEKKDQMAGQQKVDTAVAKAAAGRDPKELMKIFDSFKRENTAESSWASIYLLKKFGFDEAANEELAKKGYGARFEHVTLPNNEEAMIKFTPKGEPLSGITANGERLSANDLIGVNPTSKNAMYTGGSKIYTIPRGDANEGQEYTSRFNTHSGKHENIITSGPNAGKVYTGAPGLEKRVETNAAITENKLGTSKQLIDYRLGQNLKYAGPMAYTKAGAAYVGKYNAENGTSLGYNRDGVLVDHHNDNKPVVQNKDGSIEAVQRVEKTGTGTPANNVAANTAQITDLTKPPAYDPTMSPRENKLAQDNWAATRKKVTTDFITGKQGQAVQSMNVAVDHLDSLNEAAQALKNGNMPLFNQIGNMYSRNTGSPAVTDFNALKTIVGSEVAKAVAGGATALGDREEIRKEIDAANSPDQLAGVITKYQKLMAGQVKGLKQTYESAGLKDFDSKLLPRTKKVLNEVSEPTRSKW